MRNAPVRIFPLDAPDGNGATLTGLSETLNSRGQNGSQIRATSWVAPRGVARRSVFSGRGCPRARAWRGVGRSEADLERRVLREDHIPAPRKEIRIDRGRCSVRSEDGGNGRRLRHKAHQAACDAKSRNA